MGVQWWCEVRVLSHTNDGQRLAIRSPRQSRRSVMSVTRQGVAGSWRTTWPGSSPPAAGQGKFLMVQSLANPLELRSSTVPTLNTEFL